MKLEINAKKIETAEGFKAMVWNLGLELWEFLRCALLPLLQPVILLY